MSFADPAVSFGARPRLLPFTSLPGSPCMAIKIGNYDPTPLADVAHKLVLINPSSGEVLVDDAGENCGLWLYGTDARQYKATQARQQDAMLQAYSISGGIRATEQSQKNDAIELLIAATKDWWNITLEDQNSDTATPFSIENCEKLYRRNPWIMEQAERFIKNRRNFLPKPAAPVGSALPSPVLAGPSGS